MQTIELNGRPLAVMGGDHDAVEEFAEGDGFRADLLSFVDEDGLPLWDGKGMFSASVRDPLPEEAAVFEVSFALAVAAGDADEHDPGDWLVFLVEVHDTTEGPERS
jgi:hypothetical protein